jgi:uncharacterized membrane protein YqjE
MNVAAAPLLGRGKSLLDQALRVVQTRLEVLSVEIQREKLIVVRQLWLAAAGAVCVWLALFTAILWAALTLAPRERSIVLGIVVGVTLLGALGSWLALRKRTRREPLFSRAIQQLQLDRDSLGRDSER